MNLLFLSSCSSLLLLLAVHAHPNHHHRSLAHSQIAKKQLEQNNTVKRSSAKCKPRPQQAAPSPAAAHPPSADHKQPSSTPAAYKPPSSPKSTPTPKVVNTPHVSSPSVSGIINVQVDRCGQNGAQKTTSATRGPNGSLDWMNCGVTGSGWKPPYMTLDDIITVNLQDAIKDSNSPFKACAPYAWAFQQYGQQYGVPSIILASFALQESSCNPHTVGGAGEQGLMQLTKDKCGGAPNGDCQDVGYNVRTGAKYFSDLYNSNGKDLLKSIGNYNGWAAGMTIGSATAAGNGNCCRCQNNLDYLFQFLNGWVVNVNAYGTNPRLGKYFNLDKCGHGY